VLKDLLGMSDAEIGELRARRVIWPNPAQGCRLQVAGCRLNVARRALQVARCGWKVGRCWTLNV